MTRSAKTPKTSWKTGSIAALIIVLISCVPLLFAIPLGDWQSHVQDLKARVDALGDAAPLVFTAVTTLSIALGAPRLIFCALGGLLFGFAWGFALSQLGTMIGEYATFLFARWTARTYLLEKFPRLRSLSTRMQGTGWWSVVLVRQMPISGLYNDFLLGLSPVSHRDFWIGSALGFLPLGVTASLIGAGMMQADLAELGRYLALAAVSFFLLNASWNWVVGQARKQQAS
jgi:uncharacterized membrane protein YdjX (TVP38/TMEM64 family)